MLENFYKVDKNSDEYDFAVKIIEEMKKKNILPAPENYNLYFYSMLDENKKLQKSHLDLHFKVLKFEKKINELIKHNKVILGFIKGLNNFIKREKTGFNKKLDGIKYSINRKNMEKQIEKEKKELNEFIEAIEKGLKKIENNYFENVDLIKNISSCISYDHKYDIHNYNFLLKEIEKEFNYNLKISSLIFFKINFQKSINKKDKDRIIKGTGKIILNFLRKNDIVVYKDKFFILLRNVDFQKAVNIIKRIEKSIKEAVFFVNNKEFDFDIEYEILELKNYKDFNSFLKVF